MMPRRILLLCLCTIYMLIAKVNAENTTDCWDVCSYYLGTADVTVSGIRCQSWSAQSPHKHILRTDDWFPFEGLNEAENHCRDPNVLWKPWCFTEDPDVRLEQCDIPLCNSSITSGNITCNDEGCDIDRTHCADWDPGLWTTLAGAVTGFGITIPSVDDTTSTVSSTLLTVDDNMTSDNSNLPTVIIETAVEEVNAENTTDCWDVCSYYLGGTDVTASGIRCQKWRVQSPHEHYYQTDDWFPFEGLNASENHCRDPNGGNWKPWCFTEDPDVRWEQCDIPLCNSSITSANITCGDNGCDIDRTHCPDWHTGTTVAADNTTNNYTVADADCWDVCKDYTGTVNHTRSGLPCQRWTEQTPHAHYFTDDYGLFPDIGGLSDSENYCRDPETGQWKPWCFTTNPGVRWEICDIPLCNSDTTTKDVTCGDQVCGIDRSHCNVSSIAVPLVPHAYLFVILSSVKVYTLD